MDFYYISGSAPCRSVLLTLRALGLEANLKVVDLMKGEHMTPEFLKLNPQHTVPTLNDNGFVLWESRAILQYLADKYGKDDSLYPKDVQKRSVVNQRLYFDMGTLYQRFGDVYYPMIFGGVADVDEQKYAKLEEAYQFLDKFLESSTYVAGNSITIADNAIVASVSTAVALGFDLSKFPNVAKWFSKCKAAMPGYQELNEKGAQDFKVLFDTMRAKK